jgi:glycine/D-amino acid oxidase-like deaminating enzyme
MAKLRMGRPLWLDRLEQPPRRRHPTLRHSMTVEVAIVGGGVTGAAVAWLFANAGIRVALLDAALVGHGSTVASTALLMQEPDSDFSDLAARYGPRRATRIWELSGEATGDLIRTLHRLEIDCYLERLDSVYYTTDPEKVEHLEDELRQRKRHHLGGRWLNARALKRATGIAGEAGIRTHGNGQVDPHKACVGLLRAAESKGARIFERSPVRRIVPRGSSVDVVSRSGTVRAGRVVIATGYATPEFKPLAGRFRMMHTFVVATRPIAAATRRDLGLGHLMLWDTERPYYYARWTTDHRLIFGGADRPQPGRRARAKALHAGAKTVRQHFTRLYPALESIDIDYAGEGLFATTPDGLPYVGPHRRYPRHLFALGYGGNGMTFGFLAARLLLDRYSGATTDDHELFAFNRLRNSRSG